MTNRIWLNPQRPEDLVRPITAIGILATVAGTAIVANVLWLDGNWMLYVVIFLALIVPVLVVMATAIEASRADFVTTDMQAYEVQDMINGHWKSLGDIARQDNMKGYTASRPMVPDNPAPEPSRSEVDTLKNYTARANAGGAMADNGKSNPPIHPDTLVKELTDKFNEIAKNTEPPLELTEAEIVELAPEASPAARNHHDDSDDPWNEDNAP